jgi:hypothetical protein
MAKRESEKPEIFRRLFNKRWDPNARRLSDPLVLTNDVDREYADYNKERGIVPKKSRNPYAFIKDFLRVRRRANLNWPPEIFAAGYTGRQVTGDGRVFEFIPILAGQTEPFPSTAPPPPADSIPYKLSSVSMPLASRRLGRTDEPWLVQVSVRLHVVETYFALFSTRRDTIRQVDHLQNALKLNRTEIDALFLGIEETSPGDFREFMISCEAKRLGEDIITEQVIAQAKAVFHLDNVNQPFVVPIALKSIGPSKIHIVEYQEVSREDADSLETLSMVNQAVFELVPAVPGIGTKGSPRPRKKKKKPR